MTKDDLEMLEDALKIVDGTHNIINAQDGLLGLEMLNQLLNEGKLPCLIVLDINMPKLDGRQTFIAIKSDYRLSKIPIVIFSTSTSLLDKTFFKRHHTAYLVKPVKLVSLRGPHQE